jgi:carbamoyltransferase
VFYGVENMYVPGINAVYHELAACLLKNGAVVAAVEVERLNRVKHGKLSTPKDTKQLPWLAIQHCLESEGISLKDCSHINICNGNISIL